MYKEKELLAASNAYHRLDKSQNFNCNKAFAQTIISDLKQKQRQEEFERRLGLEEENTTEVSRMQKEASRELFKRQKSEIYHSTSKSSNTNAVSFKMAQNASAAEI